MRTGKAGEGRVVAGTASALALAAAVGIGSLLGPEGGPALAPPARAQSGGGGTTPGVAAGAPEERPVEAVPPGAGDAPPTEPVPAPLAVPSPVPVPQPTPVPEPAPIPEPAPLATEVPLGGEPQTPAPGAAPGEQPVVEAPEGAAAAGEAPPVAAPPGAPAPETGEVPPGAAEAAPTEALDQLREELLLAEEERQDLDERLTAQEEATAALEDELALRAEAERAVEFERQERIAAMEGSEATLEETDRLLSTGTETGVGALLDTTDAELQAFEASALGAERTVEADQAAAARKTLDYAREALLRDDLFEARIALGLARALARDARRTAETAPSPPPAELGE